MRDDEWPELRLSDWEPTYLTLHRFTQIVGKVQLGLATPLNHWWHIAMRVTSQGLTTPSMPAGSHHLTITFDFCAHRLLAHTSDKRTESFALEPMTVAAFYERLLATLGKLGVAARVSPVPVEVVDVTPFPTDTKHASYDRLQVEKLHRILLGADRIFSIHRSRFVGKSSPVHFFWGAFDLAVTRFSGQPNATPPPDSVMGEAYSHEVVSHGFWPGGDWPGKSRVEEAVFYAYALPEPQGFRDAPVPRGAAYSPELGEFLLPYEAVRSASDPDALLLEFMEATYRAAAERGGWDIAALTHPRYARTSARSAAQR